MKLNLDIICDYLPKEYHVERFGPNEKAAFLDRPLLYGGESALQQGRLYVALADMLPKVPLLRGTTWICMGASLPCDLAKSNIPILFLTNVSNIFTAYNEIQGIYDKFEAWEDTLRDELEKEETFDINQIIEVGSRMLENHIGVSNQFLEVILSSEIVQQPDGQIHVSVSEVPFYPPIRTEERVKEVLEKEGTIAVPFLSSIQWKECRLYCYNLYPLGHYVGSVYVVERYRPFRESDFPIANRFFSYFQLAFQKYLRSFSRVESTAAAALRSLFLGAPLSEEEQAQLTLGEDELWVCFKMQGLPSKRHMPKDLMSVIICALMPNTAYAIIHDDVITGLLRVQSKDLDVSESTIAIFQEIASRMDYIGGFSNTFTDMSRINHYLSQADYAVELSRQIEHTEPMCFFHNYILQYMLSKCTGHMPLESLYSKGLSALIEHDRKRDTSYIDTLDTYLKNEMNITRTAEALYLHRTSLMKRLDRIQRLLGEDLNDPDARLYYRICLHLLDKSSDSASEK